MSTEESPSETNSQLISNTSRTRKPKKNLSNEQRQAIFQFLLKESNNGKLKRGSIQTASDLFSTSTRTVNRIWERAKDDLLQHKPVNVSSRIPKKVGRKRTEIDMNKIQEIPLCRRTNIRSFAKALNVPKSTLHRRIKEGVIRQDSNVVQPLLMTENTEARTGKTKKKNLSNEQRQAIFQFLLKESNNGKLKRGSIQTAAEFFSASMRTVSRIWERAKDNLLLGKPVDVSSRIPKKVGRNRIQIDMNKIEEIPLCRRTNIRSFAEALNVPKSTLHRRIKEGMIKLHSNKETSATPSV